ncbi:MAG: hypothetical protein ACE15C_21625 [Phycisphaerae bacterium]
MKLFSPAKDKFTLTIRMERFLKEPKVELPLSPVLVQQALRATGLVAVTHSPGRSVELKNLKNLARVDAGRLPEAIRGLPGATAYRFITADYGATLDIGTVEPRVTVTQNWALGVQTDALQLRGRLVYDVQRSGVFQVIMNLPTPWEVVSVTPPEVVDDFQLAGAGATRTLTILLKKEMTGPFAIDLTARVARTEPTAPVDFVLPLADARNLQQFTGVFVLYLPDQLRPEIDKLDQFAPLALAQAQAWTNFPGLSPAMAFEFKALDRAKPAGAKFKIIQKPTQISAVVNRLVNIQQGAIEQEALVQYNILYAPVDALYLKVPTAMVDAGLSANQITGPDIKEKVVVDESAVPVPKAQGEGAASKPAEAPVAMPATAPLTRGAGQFTYYKIVLQSPVMGAYTLRVNFRQGFTPAKTGSTVPVEVEPILAAGNITDQSGHIAIAKADTLAVVGPKYTGLIEADPSSATDLPYEPHRKIASLAFKYNVPPFSLTLPVLTQAEASVITTMANAAIIEQVLARDGRLNTRAVWLLSTSRGDRLAVTLPTGATLYEILVNGASAPVEGGKTADEKIVRLPPSAGQVTKVVVEVSFGMDKASASKLPSPALPKDLPVQQALWRCTCRRRISS